MSFFPAIEPLCLSQRPRDRRWFVTRIALIVMITCWRWRSLSVSNGRPLAFCHWVFLSLIWLKFLNLKSFWSNNFGFRHFPRLWFRFCEILWLLQLRSLLWWRFRSFLLRWWPWLSLRFRSWPVSFSLLKWFWSSSPIDDFFRPLLLCCLHARFLDHFLSCWRVNYILRRSKILSRSRL